MGRGPQVCKLGHSHPVAVSEGLLPHPFEGHRLPSQGELEEGPHNPLRPWEPSMCETRKGVEEGHFLGCQPFINRGVNQAASSRH